MSKVRINVSDIGSICGYLERFESSCYASTLDKYRSKYVAGHKRKYNDIGSTLAKKIAKLPDVNLEKLVAEPERAVVTEPERAVVEVIKELRKTSKAEVFHNEIKRATNMAEGIKHEDDALTLYMKERGYTNIDTQMYKIINFGNFDVVGMCDGLLEDRIIEIKNRNNGRFKNGPWLNEKCQCQMYMFMFGLNKCDFVEHHRGHIVTSELYRDDKFINETIMPKLKKFIDELFI